MPSDAPKPDETRTRVLLVDDHPVMRQGMAAIINEEPDLVVCGEADGVRTAIAAATQTHPDVALVDLSVTDGDGLELIRDFKNRFPELRTLVLSMFDETVYAERALRAGAGGYVMKAEAATTVMAAIRTVLKGETYLSPRMATKLTPPLSRERSERPRPAAAAEPAPSPPASTASATASSRSSAASAAACPPARSPRNSSSASRPSKPTANTSSRNSTSSPAASSSATLSNTTASTPDPAIL